MPEPYNFVKKETLAQMFSCEFCEISKHTYFNEHLWATASERYEELKHLPINPLTLFRARVSIFFHTWKKNVL